VKVVEYFDAKNFIACLLIQTRFLLILTFNKLLYQLFLIENQHYADAIIKSQKIMKKLLFLLSIIFSVPTFGQNVILLNLGFGELIIYNTTRTRIGVITGNYIYTDREKINILEKQYLSEDYLLSRVDDFKSDSYVRFNHYNGQMEFIKNGTIHYLKKEEGRTVEFKDYDLYYKVYKLHGNLDYLLVKVEGKNSFLVKQSSKFIPPERTRTSYGFQINPKFRRNKDKYILAKENGELVELSWNKRRFLSAFGEKKLKVKEFMTKRDLSHKRADDIATVVEYINSL